MNIGKIRERVLAELSKSADVKTLDMLRVNELYSKGKLTGVLRSLKNKPLAERRRRGSEANKLQKELETIFSEAANRLMTKNQKLTTDPDLTRPGEKISVGHRHPLTRVENEIREIFSSMNFTIVEGPEVETEYYNFDALNIPANHPARDMWDTFWLKSFSNPSRMKSNKSRITNSILEKNSRDNIREKFERYLLRTHTSPVQIRYMETHKPPFQIVVPGRVFRYEATDASHEINFYQLEGLMVGSSVSLANFKFVIEEFFKKFFEDQKIQFRFRPSYFPFVEPGLEVDIKLTTKNRKLSTWLEIMGAGMVHPRVFEAVKYKNVQGFAFGVGIDRLAMIKYGIPDIRLFYNGDLRFIRQF